MWPVFFEPIPEHLLKRQTVTKLTDPLRPFEPGAVWVNRLSAATRANILHVQANFQQTTNPNSKGSDIPATAWLSPEAMDWTSFMG